MKKSLGSKTIFYPMPVLVIGTYNDDGTPNAMNAAWGGIYDEREVILCLSDDHMSAKNIKKRRAFTLAFADEVNIAAADYVGIASGNQIKNKLDKCGLTTVKSEFVDAPVINEFPIALECKVKKIVTSEGTYHVIGVIENILCEEKFIERKRINIDEMNLLTFDSAMLTYRPIGKATARAFKVGLKYNKQ